MARHPSLVTPSQKHAKARKLKVSRSLNALAVAEQQDSAHSKVRRNRLGASEPESLKRKRSIRNDASATQSSSRPKKRGRAENQDRGGNDVEIGSDSSGNEWLVGQVASDDDSDLDSDEAMGKSDEERLNGFTFRGSSKNTLSDRSRQKPRKAEMTNEGLPNIDLDEGEAHPLSSKEGDGLGDDAVDLATMLDMSGESESESGSHGSRTFGGSDSGGSFSDEHGDTTDNESLAEREQSVLSFSDDENDRGDTTKLVALQSLVATMNEQDKDRSLTKAPTDIHEAIAPSESALQSKRKLTVADLIPSVTDTRLRKSLKILSESDSRGSGKGSIPRKLDVPLPKRQQDRLDRAAAYEKSKETLNRWIDTVKHNRRADHLSFPLRNPNTTAALGSRRLVSSTHSQPLTDLESTIQNIMQASGLATTNGKSDEHTLQAFEDLQTNKMPLEDVQARRAELRRARDLLFREELRAKRISKIKSKTYRKVHRKERERNIQQERDALRATGVDDSESEKERNDRRRAEERMGARHREGKWAKGVKGSGRARWDEDARSGVTEMARRGEELKRRIEGKRVAEDGDGMVSSESEIEHEDDIEFGNSNDKHRSLNQLQKLKDSDAETVNKIGGSKLASMEFMKKAEALRKARNDADLDSLRQDLTGQNMAREDEGVENGPGRRVFGPLMARPSGLNALPPKQINEFEERQDSDADDDENRAMPREEELEFVANFSEDRKISSAFKKPSLVENKGQTRPQMQDSLTSQVEENPWLISTKKDSNAKKKKQIQDDNAEAIISNDPSATTATIPTGAAKLHSTLKGARKAEVSRQILQAPVAHPQSNAKESTDEDGDEDEIIEELPFINRNQDLVRRAFAGDSVVADFEREKQQIVQDEGDKVIDVTLPGWGTWTGAGIGKKAEKRNKGKVLRKEMGIAKEKRKDAKLNRVIINEKHIKKNNRYLASTLPHPFETRQQYERSLRLPVGPEWTTKETFQGMTKPRILMKQGIITPIVKPIV